MSVNFGDLRSKVQAWTADDEDLLLAKLKEFSEKYTSKCEEIYMNIDNIEKNTKLVEMDYYNNTNRMKNISMKKFVEHIVVSDRSQKNNEESGKNDSKQHKTKIISKEEREMNLFQKFKTSIATSLENLNIKNLIDLRDNNESIITDDNISLSSSRVFNNNNKYKDTVKLPFIIGTNEFFSNEYLGIGSDFNIPFLDRNIKKNTINLEKQGIILENDIDLRPKQSNNGLNAGITGNLGNQALNQAFAQGNQYIPPEPPLNSKLSAGFGNIPNIAPNLNIPAIYQTNLLDNSDILDTRAGLFALEREQEKNNVNVNLNMNTNSNVKGGTGALTEQLQQKTQTVNLKEKEKSVPRLNNFLTQNTLFGNGDEEEDVLFKNSLKTTTLPNLLLTKDNTKSESVAAKPAEPKVSNRLFSNLDEKEDEGESNEGKEAKEVKEVKPKILAEADKEKKKNIFNKIFEDDEEEENRSARIEKPVTEAGNLKSGASLIKTNTASQMNNTTKNNIEQSNNFSKRLDMILADNATQDRKVSLTEKETENTYRNNIDAVFEKQEKESKQKQTIGISRMLDFDENQEVIKPPHQSKEIKEVKEANKEIKKDANKGETQEKKLKKIILMEEDDDDIFENLKIKDKEKEKVKNQEKAKKENKDSKTATKDPLTFSLLKGDNDDDEIILFTSKKKETNEIKENNPTNANLLDIDFTSTQQVEDHKSAQTAQKPKILLDFDDVENVFNSSSNQKGDIITLPATNPQYLLTNNQSNDFDFTTGAVIDFTTNKPQEDIATKMTIPSQETQETPKSIPEQEKKEGESEYDNQKSNLFTEGIENEKKLPEQHQTDPISPIKEKKEEPKEEKIETKFENIENIIKNIESKELTEGLTLKANEDPVTLNTKIDANENKEANEKTWPKTSTILEQQISESKAPIKQATLDEKDKEIKITKPEEEKPKVTVKKTTLNFDDDEADAEAPKPVVKPVTKPAVKTTKKPVTKKKTEKKTIDDPLKVDVDVDDMFATVVKEVKIKQPEKPEKKEDPENLNLVKQKAKEEEQKVKLIEELKVKEDELKVNEQPLTETYTSEEPKTTVATSVEKLKSEMPLEEPKEDVFERKDNELKTEQSLPQVINSNPIHTIEAINPVVEPITDVLKNDEVSKSDSLVNRLSDKVQAESINIIVSANGEMATEKASEDNSALPIIKEEHEATIKSEETLKELPSTNLNNKSHEQSSESPLKVFNSEQIHNDEKVNPENKENEHHTKHGEDNLSLRGKQEPIIEIDVTQVTIPIITHLNEPNNELKTEIPKASHETKIEADESSTSKKHFDNIKNLLQGRISLKRPEDELEGRASLKDFERADDVNNSQDYRSNFVRSSTVTFEKVDSLHEVKPIVKKKKPKAKKGFDLLESEEITKEAQSNDINNHPVVFNDATNVEESPNITLITSQANSNEAEVKIEEATATSSQTSSQQEHIKTNNQATSKKGNKASKKQEKKQKKVEVNFDFDD